MNDIDFMIARLQELSDITVVSYKKGHSILAEKSHDNPLKINSRILEVLLEMVEHQTSPVIYRDGETIFYGGVNAWQDSVFVGTGHDL